MKRKTNQVNHRLHLVLTQEQSAALTKLGQELNSGSHVGTIRTAIDVLAHIVEGASNGGQLILRTADGKEREIIFVPLIPCLPHKHE